MDELLNLSCRPIKALREAGDFVMAFDSDACAKIAGTERVDAALQAFEASADLSHDGKGSEAYRYHREKHQQVKIRACNAGAEGHAGDQQTTIRQAHARERAAARPMLKTQQMRVPCAGHGQRTPNGRNDRPVLGK